jgi:prepilin-type N-terminal cleavage/methylation domain-containing protein
MRPVPGLLSARIDGHAQRAFTLVELVMVVTIMGIVAAIAVPRMSNATQRAQAAALQASVESVRSAIDCYYAEHNSYPGYDPANGSPSGGYFVNQLTMYSNATGQVSATLTGPYFYGPYLRKPFPVNPTNKLSNVYVKATPSVPDPADGSVGWIAVLSHGYFGISAVDAELEIIIIKPGDRPRLELN